MYHIAADSHVKSISGLSYLKAPLHNVSSIPQESKGSIIYNIGDNLLYYSIGSKWIPIGGNYSIPVPIGEIFNSDQINYMDSKYVSVSGDIMTGTLDMGNQKITTTYIPVNPADVINLAYFTAHNGSGSGSISSNTTNINMNNNKITNLQNPTDPGDALSLGFADSRYVNTTGDAMTGTLDMGNNKITSTYIPINNADVVNLAYLKTNSFQSSGVTPMSGALNMNSFKIINLADPINPTDALSLGFADSRYVNITGDIMTGTLDMGSNKITTTYVPVNPADVVNIAFLRAKSFMTNPLNRDIDMNNFKITNLYDPSLPTDAMTLQYADLHYVNTTGDTMTGTLDMGNQKITTTYIPVDPADLVNLAYIRAHPSGLSPDGTTPMIGTLNMNNFKIINLANPTVPTDAVNMGYADGKYVMKAGDTMTGVLHMNGNTIKMTHVPAEDDDVVNVLYCKANYLALSGGTMTGGINAGTFPITKVGVATNIDDALTLDYLMKSFVVFRCVTTVLGGNASYPSFYSNDNSIIIEQGSVDSLNWSSNLITIEPTSKLFGGVCKFTLVTQANIPGTYKSAVVFTDTGTPTYCFSYFSPQSINPFPFVSTSTMAYVLITNTRKTFQLISDSGSALNLELAIRRCG